LTWNQSNQFDGYLKVTDEQAIPMARQFAKEEGIFTGFSSGAKWPPRCSYFKPLLREKPRADHSALKILPNAFCLTVKPYLN
jgi:cysteine synthase